MRIIKPPPPDQPDPGDAIPPAQIHVNADALQATGLALHQLVMVLNALVPLSLKIANVQVIGGETGHPEIDGGAQVAATNTVIHVCDRIDRIVKDDSRWSVKPAEESHDLFKKMIGEQLQEGQLRRMHLEEQINLVRLAQHQILREMEAEASMPPESKPKMGKKIATMMRKKFEQGGPDA